MLTPDWLQEMGALQVMQMLKELHKRGYQKLRWFSYMSPNGCALRCHITTQDNICMNREIMVLEEDVCLWMSTTSPDSHTSGAKNADLFLRHYSRLAEKGRGTDPDYVEWFDKIYKRAKKKEFPEYFGDWYDAPLGFIKVDDGFYPGPPMTMRLISWNIDGIKAKFDALQRLVAEYQPDVICLQKVKDSKCSKAFDLDGYKRYNSVGPYAGVTTYVKKYIPVSPFTLASDKIVDGHALRTDFDYPHFSLFNIYVPYSNPKVEGAVAHRKAFDQWLAGHVGGTPDRIIICGDMNIVHGPLDCWDKKFERNQANFLDWERDNFNELLENNALVDTYAMWHRFGHDFSYFFRNDPKVREKNQGLRIDYFLASQSFVPSIRRAEIIKNVTVSTNNPILLEFTY